ncbi:MAG: isoprenyl transferase [Phycisphaeraceae bacterium]|nr:isoprenyl transferase [Phycisphaeraceae bacterium]
MTDPPPKSDPDQPRHVAIIMDGNGRWAQRHGRIRTEGHRQGAVAARNTMLACSELGLEALTLYSFSTENWKRPAEEIQYLMNLGIEYLESEARIIFEHNIRFRHIGHRDRLSQQVLDKLDHLAEASAANTGLSLNLALNYGGRSEITEAVRRIASAVADGKLAADRIDEQTIAENLFTAGLPDPDLLIRTAGEMRLSNFLLWQISYAELWVSDVLWPDFDREQLLLALEDYAQRQRKFGNIETPGQ